MNFIEQLDFIKTNIQSWQNAGWGKKFKYLVNEFAYEDENTGMEGNVFITKAEHASIITYLASQGYINLADKKPDDFQILNKVQIEILPKIQPTIKPKALELIAIEIGEMDSGPSLVEFLTECGVDERLIVYPNTKWRMIYAVLLTLSNSRNPKDHEVLFRVIEESVHPLMHRGDEELAKKYEDKFNRLLSYDGFSLRNGKIKRNIKEREHDSDLDLYIKKKILVEAWRDDLPHPLQELSFNQNTLEQICYSLWDLFSIETISLGVNTTPEKLLIEADPRFHQEIVFNWDLVRDLDNNPHKIENEYGFDIELLNRERLDEDVNEEIAEFVSNMAATQNDDMVENTELDAKLLKIPSYIRGTANNYYSYKKQRKILLEFIAKLYKRFENEIIVIKFKDIKDTNINVLRTLLALESEQFFDISELRNNKKRWTDEDDIYAKIQVKKLRISALKKFLLAPAEHPSELQNKIAELPQETKKEPLSIHVIGLKEGLEAIAGAKKESGGPKFPHKIPAGVEWSNVIIKFLDEETIHIRVRQLAHTTTYEEMKLVGKKGRPSVLWFFLLTLAKVGGEVSIKDPEAKDEYKKQKELISKKLKEYFTLQDDPFFPYQSSEGKTKNSYRTRFQLIPPEEDAE